MAALTNGPGNEAAIGGLKIVTENGWFAARPSGTEANYKFTLKASFAIHISRKSKLKRRQ